jgi:hypothetical protein
MDASQLLEIKGIIEKRLIFEMIENAKNIDVSKYPRVRFVIELNFDSNGLLADAGVEPRYRRSLK